jgi:hypothetical protein
MKKEKFLRIILSMIENEFLSHIHLKNTFTLISLNDIESIKESKVYKEWLSGESWSPIATSGVTESLG